MSTIRSTFAKSVFLSLLSGAVPLALAAEVPNREVVAMPFAGTTAEAVIPIPSGPKSATKAELDAIRTRNALEAERAKGVKIGGNGPGAGPAVPAIEARPIPLANHASMSSAASASASNAARVTMVAGPQGALVATIQTTGGLIIARTGDKVPGLGTVRAISINQVTVVDGKREFLIPFAAEPGSSPLPGSPGTAGNMPYGGR